MGRVQKSSSFSASCPSWCWRERMPKAEADHCSTKGRAWPPTTRGPGRPACIVVGFLSCFFFSCVCDFSISGARLLVYAKWKLKVLECFSPVVPFWKRYVRNFASGLFVFIFYFFLPFLWLWGEKKKKQQHTRFESSGKQESWVIGPKLTLMVRLQEMGHLWGQEKHGAMLRALRGALQLVAAVLCIKSSWRGL